MALSTTKFDLAPPSSFFDHKVTLTGDDFQSQSNAAGTGDGGYNNLQKNLDFVKRIEITTTTILNNTNKRR
jgi:hypothetical protein